MSLHNTIVKGISKNLEQTNFLVLPNFGAFILQTVGAQIKGNNKQLIFPPQKKVSFNSQIKQNDGVLAAWLQNEINCTNAEANNKLVDFSEYCNSVLNSKSRITIEGIGFFYKDLENNLCFEPDEKNNFFIESFGLEPINLNVVSNTIISANNNKNEKIDRVISIESPVINKKRQYQKFVAPIAIASLLISFLAIALTNNKISGVIKSSVFSSENVVNYQKLNYADLTLKPFENTKTNFVSNANGFSSLTLAHNKTLLVKMYETDLTAVEDKTTVSKNHFIAKKSNHKFNIVLGCFSVMANAKKMINQLTSKNIEAYVSGKNNKDMFIVSAGGFDNKESAIQKLEAIKQSYPNAWIKSED